MNLVGLICLGVFFLVTAGTWLGMVIYTYLAAERQGMSQPWLWALGVLLTGPVGLIAFLIDQPTAKLIACRHCQRTIREDIPCPYCGAPPE